MVGRFAADGSRLRKPTRSETGGHEDGEREEDQTTDGQYWAESSHSFRRSSGSHDTPLSVGRLNDDVHMTMHRPSRAIL